MMMTPWANRLKWLLVEGSRNDPSLDDMAEASERARRLYWQRRGDLVASNDQQGLDELDRNFSWLDFV